MGCLVEVGAFYDLPEATVAAAALDAAEIPNRLFGYAHASMAWHTLTAIQGVRLMVLPEDAESARAILAEAVAATAEAPTTSADGRWKLLPLLTGLLGIAIAAVPSPLHRRR